MRRGPLLVLLGVLLLWAPQPAAAQPDDLNALRREIEALKESQRALRQEIKEMKELLREQQTPALRDGSDVFIAVGGHPFKGHPHARVTLVEFSDYQCPFCARHAREAFPQLEREYINTGKVKYVFRDFPIVSIHKDAFKAAEAAHCARDRGKFWEMHDRLFAHQAALGPKDLLLHAQTLGLDPQEFQRCVDSGKFAATIRQGLADGQRAGVRGTPTFFLGLTDANDARIRTVRMIRGAQSYATFRDAIEALLAASR